MIFGLCRKSEQRTCAERLPWHIGILLFDGDTTFFLVSGSGPTQFTRELATLKEHSAIIKGFSISPVALTPEPLRTAGLVWIE